MLNVVLDSYDYELALAVIENNCLKNNFMFLSLHLDIGPISQIRRKGLSANASVNTFIMDYDGLCLGVATAWETEQQQKIDKIIQRANNGEEIMLWHRGSAETVCAFYFMNSLLQPTGAPLWEGVHLTDILTQFRYDQKSINCGNIHEILDQNTRRIDPASVDRYSRIWEKLEAEDGDMRILFAPNHFPVSVTYDYFDNFILSYFPQDKSIPMKVVLHNIFKDIGGRSHLWESFIIFRLHTLKDEAFLEYVSSLRHDEEAPIKPDIYRECWKKVSGRKELDDCRLIDDLISAIAADINGEDRYEEITYLLHNIPLDKSSVDKLLGLLNSPWKDEVCSALLVRLGEYITHEQRCDLLLKLGE